MVAETPKTIKWLIEYADRLVRLHQLLASDEGDSDAADVVRDEMDLSWRMMSEFETRLARELSADLYTISASPVESEPLRPEFRMQINEALDQQRYGAALELIRGNSAQLDVSAGAFLRGICWSGLGVNSAAAEFFLHAERSQPGMPEARLCALSTLISGSREQEALDLATQWARESDDPSLVLKASEVVFLNAIRLPVEKARPLYERTIELASRALRQYAKEPSDPATDTQAIVALLQIAVSYARLGDMVKAREFSSRARKQSPDSVVAITVDGMLNEDATPVGDAAKVEVARRIVGAPSGSREEDSATSIPLSSERVRQVFALN